ncbi:MAG TPA: hypothetical protein VMH83_02130 [Candidatus Acidoferrum sp.]|nr:hypothetical protein [Candidatus Acidoferrum sp.]
MTPNDTHDEIPSIVPERDELVQHRKQLRGSSQAARSAGSEAPGRTSGVVVFFLTILTLGMLGTGGGAWYFYQQSEQTKADLVAATGRIASLEGTLNVMDESTKKSAMTLRDKVDNSAKEISNLWAARNTIKTDVDKQGVALNALQKTSNELENTVNSHGQTLTQHTNQLSTAQTRIEQVAKNFAGMENLGQQLTALNADLNRVKASQTKIENDVEKRLRANEQDIESINVNRMQTNQTLNTLQTNINALQQKVGK